MHEKNHENTQNTHSYAHMHAHTRTYTTEACKWSEAPVDFGVKFYTNWCSFTLFLMLFCFPLFFFFFFFSCFDMTSALLWMNWCTHSPIVTTINTQLSSSSCGLYVFHTYRAYNTHFHTKQCKRGAKNNKLLHRKRLSNNLNIGTQS